MSLKLWPDLEKTFVAPIGRLIRFALPLIKMRSRLKGLSLGARGLVFDDRGRVLLVRHTYIPEWHLPGGAVEPGETAAEAFTREVAEEGGVRLLGPPKFLGLFHNPEWTVGDHVAFFEAGRWAPCPNRWGMEIEAAEFFDLENLPADTTSSVRQRIAERTGKLLASPTW